MAVDYLLLQFRSIRFLSFQHDVHVECSYVKFFVVFCHVSFVWQFQSSSIGLSFGCGSYLLITFLCSCNVYFVAGVFVPVSVFWFLLVKIFSLFFGFLVHDSFSSDSFLFSRLIGSSWLRLLPVC